MIKVSMQFFALKRRLNASAGDNSALIANTIKAIGGDEAKIKQDAEAIYYLLESDKQVVITPDNIKSGTYEIQTRADGEVNTESAGNYTSIDDLREVLGIKAEDSNTKHQTSDRKVLRAGEHYKQALQDKHLKSEQPDQDSEIPDAPKDIPKKGEKHRPQEEKWETLESARQLPAPHRRPPLVASRRPTRRPKSSLNANREISLRADTALAAVPTNLGSNDELKQIVLNATGEYQEVGGYLFNMVDPVLGINELFMVYEDTQDHVFVITKIDPVACGKVFHTLDEVSDYITGAKSSSTPHTFEEGDFDTYIPTEEVSI